MTRDHDEAFTVPCSELHLRGVRNHFIVRLLQQPWMDIYGMASDWYRNNHVDRLCRVHSTDSCEMGKVTRSSFLFHLLCGFSTKDVLVYFE